MGTGAEMAKGPQAFRTISEVSKILETPQHVLRFWETRFDQLRPVKRAGGRRYYRPTDVALLWGIKALLYDEAVTIKGVQKRLDELGPAEVSRLAPPPWNALADGAPWPALDLGDDDGPRPGGDGLELDDIVGPPEEAPEPVAFVGPVAFVEDEEDVILRLPRPDAPGCEAGRAAEAAAPFTLDRLRAAMEAADPDRLRDASPRLAPLLARLVALRERMDAIA